MAIHWRCRFKSLSDTQYSINIYDATYSGTPVEMTGAASPFETQEPTGDDVLEPVRLSTGCIRLVNTNGIDDLLPATPKSRFVTLTHEEGGSTVTDWQGYIQQSQFTQQWDSTPCVVELPVISALSILSGYQMVKDELPPRARIAEYFRQALDATGATFSTIVFPAKMAMTDDGPWDAFWRFGIQERNWFTYRNENILDEDESRYEGVSWLDMLSSIMQAFGYTLYERGTTIYIISREGTPQYVQMAASSLATLANNGTVTETQVTPSTINLRNAQIGGNNGTIDVVPAMRKAVVEANINPFGDDVTPRVDSQFLDYASTLTVQKQQTGSPGNYYFNETLGVFEPEQGTDIWTFRSFANGTAQTWSGQQITGDYHIGAFCRRPSGENILFINYNSVGSGASGYGGDWTISIKSPAQTFFAGGFFLLQSSVEIHSGTGGALPETYSAKFQLRVGSYYYNATNNTWQTTACTFLVKINPDTNRLVPMNSWNMQQGDEKYYIPIPDTGLFGEVELRVYDPESSATTRQEWQEVYVFDDFFLDYIWPLKDKYKDYKTTDTNRFVKQMRSFAFNDFSQNIDLTSFINSCMGYGVLLKPDYSAPLGKIVSRTADDKMYFEEILIGSMYDCANNPQKMLSIPIRRDGQYSPIDYYTWGETYRYLQSRTKWRDSIQYIKIFKSI